MKTADIGVQSMVLKSNKSKLYKMYHGLDETNMNENDGIEVSDITDIAMADILQRYLWHCC